MKHTILLDGQPIEYNCLPDAYQVKVDELKNKIYNTARKAIRLQYQRQEKLPGGVITVLGDPVSDGTANRPGESVGAPPGQPYTQPIREAVLKACGIKDDPDVGVDEEVWHEGWFFTVNKKGFTTVQGVVSHRGWVVLKTQPAQSL